MICSPFSAVIESHDALNHGNFCAMTAPLKQAAQHILFTEKAVEIVRGRAEDLTVKHRVDVIRSAFECGNPHTALMKR